MPSPQDRSSRHVAEGPRGSGSGSDKSRTMGRTMGPNPECKLCGGRGGNDTKQRNVVVRTCSDCKGRHMYWCEAEGPGTVWRDCCERNPRCTWCKGSGRSLWKRCTSCDLEGNERQLKKYTKSVRCTCVHWR